MIMKMMMIMMLQDKQGVQYMVTGDGSDIVQQHNGMAAVTTSVTHQQYVQVMRGHENELRNEEKIVACTSTQFFWWLNFCIFIGPCRSSVGLGV